MQPSTHAACTHALINSFLVGPISHHCISAWARKETENYKDISVVDLKDSWGDGKAFCAIIHKYCPELM